MKKLGLYVHVPFCVSKCAYCDFLSFACNTKQDDYLKKLKDEIFYWGEKLKGEYSIDTIFIGGGTPSVLQSGAISDILCVARKHFSVDYDCEITVEANPDSLTDDKIAEYADSCTRISVGVQSTCDDTLNILSRPHTAEQAKEVLKKLTKTTLDVNADVILGLPNESSEITLKSVREILDHGIGHLSAYGLSVEDGTKLQKMLQNNECSVLDSDKVADLYDSVLDTVRGYGLDRYEVSNFAKPSKECKHNIGYWTRKSYLGVGLGAHSLLENKRFYNTCNFEEYLRCKDFSTILREEDVLSLSDEIEEEIMLRLRLKDGIDVSVLREKYGVDVFETYGKGIEKLKGVLNVTDKKICIKDEYFYSLNSIIVEFLD